MFGVIITLYYQRNKDLDEGKRLRQAQFQDEFYRLTSFLSELIANLEIRPKVEKNAQTTIFTDLSDKWNVEPSDTDTKTKNLSLGVVLALSIYLRKYRWKHKAIFNRARTISQI